MGIHIKKILIVSSILLALVIITASCSSVVGYQAMHSEPGKITQSLRGRLQQSVALLHSRSQAIFSTSDKTSDHPLLSRIHDKVSTLKTTMQSRFNALKSQSILSTTYGTSEPIPERIAFVLILTILIEFFVYLSLIPSRPLTLFMISVMINGITNPAINYIYYYLYDNVLILESMVVVIESLMIFLMFNILAMSIDFPQAMLLSLIANLLSYILASGIASLVFGSVPSSG